MKLKIDTNRLFTFGRVSGINDRADAIERCEVTRIPIRAEYDGRVYLTDVHLLTKESLLEWLQQYGGANAMAENVVGILLGHGHLHQGPQSSWRGTKEAT